MVNDIAIQDFVNAIKEQPTETITNYNGKVSKIDKEGVVWVQIHGSTIETPTALTYVKVKQGDEVSLNWRNNKLYVDGNYSTPAVGDESLGEVEDRLRVAIHKVSEDIEEVVVGEYGIVAVWTEYNMSTSNSQFVQATGYTWDVEVPAFVPNLYIWRRTVYEYADGSIAYGDPMFSAQDQVLGEVQYAQDSTNNHFWFDSTGAYVTEADGSYSTGYATRITNAGILQSYNNKLMTSWTNSGIVFYQSDGQTPYVTYGANGVTFNSSTGFEIGNNSTYLKWVKEGNQWKLRLQVDSLTIGGDPVLTQQDKLEITSITYAYALSTSGTQIPTSGWQSTPVAPTTTQYAWTRTTVTYSDGHTAVSYTVGGKTGQDGTNGTNGTSVTITSTSVKYASQSASATGAGTTPPSSGWSTAVPSVAAGDYLWSRTIVTYSDNTSTTSYAVARNGTNGSDITSQYLSWSTTGGLTLGYNNFIQSKLNLKGDGVRIYNGSGYLGAKLHAEGMTVYDVTATTESEATEVASFGAITRIGKDAERNVLITSDAVEIKDGETTKASFGETVIIGRAGEYHTSIEDDSFGISAGYEQIFDVSSGTGTKQITATDVLKPFKTMEASTAQYTRTGSLWIKQSTTYTFTLYNSSLEQNSTTFNTDVDGTSATTKSFYLNLGPQGKNTVTLSFTPATDESGNSGMVCDWTQLYERFSSNGGYLLRFFITHAATIRNPVMSFVGDINLTDGATYKVNGKAIDFVTEWGTAFETDWDANDWYYEKWASGKVEAWGAITYDNITYTASGNLYRKTGLSALIPSEIFPSTPTFVETFMHGSNTVVVSVVASASSSTSLSTQIWKVNNTTSSHTINYHAIYYPSGYLGG